MKRSIVMALAAATLMPAGAAVAQSGTSNGVRAGYSHKADLFVWPFVRVRWQGTTVNEDTFIAVTNDNSVTYKMKFFFVDGRSWIAQDRGLELTGHQSRYFSAFSGQGGSTVIPSFTLLRPTGYGMNPCDPFGNGERTLEGFILGWTVDDNNEPVCTNQIAGSATIVKYDDENAWEYKPWGFRCGTQDGDLGKNSLDGYEYQKAPQQLLIDFWATSTLWGSPTCNQFGGAPEATKGTNTDFELTLTNLYVDLRNQPDQDCDGTTGELPIPGGDVGDSEPPTNTLDILTYNESEIPISETTRCLTCWDTALASNYGSVIVPDTCSGTTPVPGFRQASPFAKSSLQTLKGKGTVKPISSSFCNRPASSPHANPLVYSKLAKKLPIVGVAHKLISFGTSAGASPRHIATAESALTAVGETTASPVGINDVKDGCILFDQTDQGTSPTLTQPGTGSVSDGVGTAPVRVRTR